MHNLNKDIIKLESVSSTNDFAKELLSQAKGLSAITVIDATEQTKGRGQKGNAWESETGKNINLSIIVKPLFLKPEQQFYLSMAVSLAITGCLKKHVDEVTIKWPNDIYLKNEKICGILIENSLLGETIQTSIIGIGLNCNQKTFSQWIPNPTSLALKLGYDIALDTVKDELLSNFEKQYNRLINNDFDTIHYEYVNHLYLYEKKSEFKDSNSTFTGSITTVYPNGILEIKTPNNEIRHFSFKEIEYIKNQ